jgi:transcriptional regulator with XRE-family HTH domain
VARRKNSKAKPRSNAEKGLPPYDPKAPRRTLVRLPVPGRKPTYHPDFDERLFKLSLLGCTEEECAKLFGISYSTYKQWCKDHLTFKAAREDGTDKADAEIAKALYHRAKGYTHKAVKIMVVDKAVVREEYLEHYPPDTKAAELWLWNRQGKRWRSKQEEESSNEMTIRVVREKKDLPTMPTETKTEGDDASA